MRVLQSDLVKALGLVGRAAASRSTLPVLTHVALVSYDNRLMVAGTDLETYVEVSIHCRAEEEEVSICVPATDFTKYVSELEDEAVELESNAVKLIVRQGENISAEFLGIPYEEFPLIPQVNDEKKIDLDLEVFEMAIHNVLHAVAEDESRPVLTGVLVQYQNNLLTTIGTDGFRLSAMNIPYDSNNEAFKLIVPAKGLGVVLKSLPEEGVVYISWDSVRLYVDLPYDGNLQTKVYLQTIDGNYVNWTQIVPKPSTAFVVSRDDLVKALKRVAVFANRDAKVIHFTPNGEVLTLDGFSTDTGESIEKLDIGYEGEEITFALNSTFVLQALATMNSVVSIEATSPNRPIVISSERDNHLCVLMPMHVRK